MENQVSVSEAAAEDVADNLTADVAADDFSVTAEETVPPKKKKKHINQQKLQDNLWGWIFCIPLIVGTVWFVYAALVMAIMLSFTNYHLDGGQTLWEVLGSLKDNVAMSNPKFDEVTGVWSESRVDVFYWYKQIFTEQTYTAAGKMNEMGAYMFNTVFYMIGIPIGMILSVFFAVCMSRDIKGGNVFRVLYYVPCVASTISVVYTFKLMFNESGVINSMLGSKLGWLNSGTTWNSLYRPDNPSTSKFMSDPYWCQGILSKMVIVVMSVWKGLGGTIILYIAGLSGVNAATKEAAQIDGASGWKIFWKVTMPDLYPVIFYNVVTSVIGGLQIYAEPELLIGGESNLTSGYVSLVFKWGLKGGNGVEQPSPAAGAAYGMFLAVIILILTLFQFWLDGRKKD